MKKRLENINNDINAKIAKNTQTKKEKVFNTIMLVLNIIANIAFFFFIPEISRGFDFSNGIDFDFNAIRIIAIIIFLFAQGTGLLLMINFYKTKPLKIKLVVAALPLTVIMVVGAYYLTNLDNLNSESEVAVKKLLNINNLKANQIEPKYFIIALAVYLILLYFIFGLIINSERKKGKLLSLEEIKLKNKNNTENKK